MLKTYLQYRKQEFLVHNLVKGREIMTKHGIMSRSQIRAPINTATCTKMKIHGNWNTINLDGYGDTINWTPRQQSEHPARINMTWESHVEKTYLAELHMDSDMK